MIMTSVEEPGSKYMKIRTWNINHTANYVYRILKSAKVSDLQTLIEQNGWKTKIS